jgi:hypothetical protein
MDDIHQIQNPVIGIVRQKETIQRKTMVRKGRPRVKVNFAVLLPLRDVHHFGWSRVAKEYLIQTGQRVSPETLERRYLKYKETQSAGKFVINVGGPPPKKKERVQVVVEKIIITRIPGSNEVTR